MFSIDNNGVIEGPYTAQEILSMDLSPETRIFDSETRKWHPLSEYNMESYDTFENDEAEEFLLNSGVQPVNDCSDINQTSETEASDDFQQYIDSLYKYVAEQMVTKNMPMEDVFRDLVQQDVPIDLAKTAVNNMYEEIRKHDNDKANTKIGIGIASLLIGLLVTAVSYSNASSGGTYIIATGAIIYGFIDLVGGIGRLKSKHLIEDDNIERILKNSHPITIKRNYPNALVSADNIYDIIGKVEKLLKKDEILKPLKISFSRDGGVMTFSVTENSITFHLNDDVATDEVKEHLNILLASFDLKR